jgi:hypothetical protein
MPRPRKDLDAFRDEIKHRIASKYTHRQIRSWLAREGLITSKGTLQSRCMAWEATRQTRTADTNTTLIEAVETAFHTTDHSDQTIADNITATGLPTTRNHHSAAWRCHGGAGYQTYSTTWLCNAYTVSP